MSQYGSPRGRDPYPRYYESSGTGDSDFPENESRSRYRESAHSHFPVLGEIAELRRALEHVHMRGRVVHPDVLHQVQILIGSAEHLREQIRAGLEVSPPTRRGPPYDNPRYSDSEDSGYGAASAHTDPQLHSYQEEVLLPPEPNRPRSNSSKGSRRRSSNTSRRESGYRNYSAEAELKEQHKRGAQQQQPETELSATTTLRSVSLKYGIAVAELRRFNPKLNKFEADEELPPGTEVNLKPELPASISIPENNRSDSAGNVTVIEVLPSPTASKPPPAVQHQLTARSASGGEGPTRTVEVNYPPFAQTNNSASSPMPIGQPQQPIVVADHGAGLRVTVNTSPQQTSPPPPASRQVAGVDDRAGDDCVLTIAQMHRITPTALVSANPSLRHYGLQQRLPPHLELVIPDF